MTKDICQLPKKILGQDFTFYSAEEAIALNEGKIRIEC
jgi:hypothetical protein